MARADNRFTVGEAREFIKYSFTFSQFTDIGTEKNLPLILLPAGGYVEQVVVKTSIAFDGPAITAAIIGVGDTTIGPTNLLSSYDGLAAVSGTNFALAGGLTTAFVKPYDFDNTEQLQVQLLSDITLATLTAGAFSVWIKIGQLDLS